MNLKRPAEIFIMSALCLSGLLTGCKAENMESNSISTIESTEETQPTNAENMWHTSNISIDEAYANLSQKIQNDNLYISIESADFYNERCYYIFRCFEDYEDRRVTVAWYAVDVETGECFDTNVLTELKPI